MSLLVLLKSDLDCFAQDSVQPLAKINKIYFKAQHYYEQRNWRAAKDAFQDFLSLSDHNSLFIPSMYYLAYCHQQLHDDQKSAALYQKVIAQASTEEIFWSQMAQKRLESFAQGINNPN